MTPEKPPVTTLGVTCSAPYPGKRQGGRSDSGWPGSGPGPTASGHSPPVWHALPLLHPSVPQLSPPMWGFVVGLSVEWPALPQAGRALGPSPGNVDLEHRELGGLSRAGPCLLQAAPPCLSPATPGSRTSDDGSAKSVPKVPRTAIYHVTGFEQEPPFPRPGRTFSGAQRRS